MQSKHQASMTHQSKNYFVSNAEKCIGGRQTAIATSKERGGVVIGHSCGEVIPC